MIQHSIRTSFVWFFYSAISVSTLFFSGCHIQHDVVFPQSLKALEVHMPNQGKNYVYVSELSSEDCNSEYKSLTNQQQKQENNP